MSLRIPLPSAPAGSFMEGLGQVNALQQQNLENQIKAVQAKYAPLTTQAEAASKLAYANLMGPQFMAKLMSSPNVLAGMDESTRNQLQQMYSRLAETQGQVPSQNMLNASVMQQQQQQSPFQWLMNKVGLGNVFGGQPQQQFPQQQFQQPFQTTPTTPVQTIPYKQYSPQNIEDAIRAYKNTPQYQQQLKTEGYATFPTTDELMNWYQQQGGIAPTPTTTPTPEAPKKSYAKRTGEFFGTIEEEKEYGKQRAKVIGDLGEQYKTGLSLRDKHNELTGIITDPEMLNMRNQIPFFQDKQLWWISKNGTPQQKELIGRFKTTANEIVGDIIRSFGGQKFRGEADISQSMKVNDNDAINVAIGKTQASMLYNEFGMERNRIARQLIKDEHLDEGEAFERADKLLDGNKIRQDIRNKLDYPVTIRNKKTGKTQTISVYEARKLGVPNV